MSRCFKLFLFGILVLTCGCTISDRHSYVDSEGRVPDDVFAAIKNGKTVKQWVVNQLGEPFIKSYSDNQRELFTYRYSSEQTKQANLLLVLRYQAQERDINYFHIVFENSMVVKHWWDKSSAAAGFIQKTNENDMENATVTPEQTDPIHDPEMIDNDLVETGHIVM